MLVKLSNAALPNNEPIAIIGMGCRFPGGSSDPGKFWNNLLDGKDCIVDVPAERWDSKRFYDSNRDMPGKVYVKSGGFLQERIDEFDALFFGISPREAASLDPQQRMLLEVSWEALEDAGIDPDSLAGSDTGVYVGGFMLDNKLTQLSPLNRHSIASNTAVGMTLTLLANRLSYVYDLKGPSMSIDTACSSSMVALDLACRSIWSGDSALALVGGVNIMHRPEIFIAMCKGGFLSSDGRSKAFDERADGYGRGEGAGIVVIKPLSAAQRDNDQIYALIRATGCNQDGRTDGITVPNPESQQALIRKVAERANVALHDIVYFEAHGTGTSIGDPIEMSAIGGTIGKNRAPQNKCIVGSVKGNIGHLEAASGIAAVIKSALCLKYKKVPPQANLLNLNPKIPFADLNIHIPRQVESLAADSDRIFSGINSFGYGGTNACAILENYNGASNAPALNEELIKANKKHVVAISAKSKNALDALASSYLSLTDNPALSLADLSYSAGARRAHLNYRLTINAGDMTEFRTKLTNYVDKQQLDEGVLISQVNEARSKLAFVFTGMGPQWWGMGRELMQTEPVFLEMVERCDALFKTIAGWSIMEEMLKPEASSIIGETQIAQPANFVLQAALVELWKSWGITPAAVVGHSVGEVTTSYVAGILTLEQALLVSHHRSRIQKKAAHQGAMLAVSLTEADVTALTAKYGNKVSIAAINAPTSITLAGDEGALNSIASELTERNVFNRVLQVEVAYHSPTMDPLLDEIRSSLAQSKPSLPTMTTFSTVTGEQVSGIAFDAEYWCKNVREPVYFYRALENMIDAGYTDFLEIGPHPVLSASIKECFNKKKVDGFIASSLNRKVAEQDAIKKCLAEVYGRGYALDWTSVSAQHYLSGAAAEGKPGTAQNFLRESPQFVRLPNYPWQRERYWNDSEIASADRVGQSIELTMLGAKQEGPVPTWISQLNRNFFDYLPDHRVEGLVVLAGASYVEAVLAANKTMAGSDACLITDLTLHNALVLDADFETQLQTACNDGRFTIHSFPAHNKNQSLLHASGKVGPLTLKHQERIDISAIKQRCDRHLPAAEVYAELGERGLQYGPYFQGIEQLWRKDGEVLARIAGHDALASQTDQFQLHPTLLDSCFQALISALPNGSAFAKQVYVPVEIEQLRQYGRLGCAFHCHGVLHQIGDKAILGDLTLMDDHGNVMVEIKNLRCQSLRSANENKIANIDDWTYQSVWRETSAVEAAVHATQKTKTVLFLNSDQKSEYLLEAFLAHDDDHVFTVYQKEHYEDSGDNAAGINPDNAEHLARLFAKLAEEKSFDHVHLVFAWAMQQDPTDPICLNKTKTLLALMKHAEALSNKTKVRLFVLTQQAAKVIASDLVKGVQQSSLIGLGRVAAVELPALACTLIDVDSTLSQQQARKIALECKQSGSEQELAFRGNARYVQRLINQPLIDVYKPKFIASPPDASIPGLEFGKELAFELAQQGSAANRPCQFQLTERTAPEDNEIEFEIESCVLDSEDVPLYGHREVCARVSAVGNLVSEYQVGETLVLKYHGRLARFICLDIDHFLAMRMPSHWNASTAAPAISAFGAAYSGMIEFANVQAQQRVLILGADTAAGQAAHRLAKERGCDLALACENGQSLDALLVHTKPICNLGSPALSTILKSEGKDAGFDVVFNAAGKIDCLVVDTLLATGGKYIDICSDSKIGSSAPVGPNKMAMSIFSETLLDGDLSRARSLLAKIETLLTNSAIQAIDSNTISLPDFSARQFNADHRPLVLSFEDAGDLALVDKASASVRIKPDASYLITGGFGGFGLGMALWLASQGAENLILVGRSGPTSDEAKQALSELAMQGVRVKAASADIGNVAQLHQLFAEISESMPPLKGIFHAAGVLDDNNLLDIDNASLEKVMLPKAAGAWNLHQLSMPLELDCFVLYSSISSLIGNRNQANYVAANAFLDALAHYRQAQGLAATSINWGALADVGMAAKNVSVLTHLAHMGIYSFTQEQALEAFSALLQSPVAQIGIFNVDWQRWKKYEPASAAARYVELLTVEVGAIDEADDKWLDLLQKQGEEAACAAIGAQFKLQLAAMLKLPVDMIDQKTPISKFGLDSLTAMDLKMKVNGEFKVEISILELMKGNSIEKVALSISQKLATLQPRVEIETAPDAENELALDLMDKLNNLDALSEDELDKLLGNELAVSE